MTNVTRSLSDRLRAGGAAATLTSSFIWTPNREGNTRSDKAAGDDNERQKCRRPKKVITVFRKSRGVASTPRCSIDLDIGILISQEVVRALEP
jgi:hypothetical protein